MTPFSARVTEGLKRSGLTLRQLCRAVDLDPSFLSKVLAGKRSPPVEEEVLRRIAAELRLDAAELIVSAGRIPSDWSGLWTDAALFARVRGVLDGRPAERKAPERPRAEPRPEPRAEPRAAPVKRASLSEELL